MPTAPNKKKITAWSFSTWAVYAKCAFKAYCQKVLKLPEPGSPALDRGNYIHQLAEAYVSAKEPPMGWKEPARSKQVIAALKKAAKGTLPVELKEFAAEFKALRAKKYVTELMMVFKQDWSITRNDDWTGAWVRIKIDTHRVDGTHATMVDYKTGKKYPDKHDQTLELYALALFITYPQVQTVLAALWYLDLPPESEFGSNETVREFTRSEMKGLMKKWESRAKPMLNDTRFSPNPSNECRWCHYRKENGGPCTKG